MTSLRILLWHVHGAWTTSFVQGPHTYLLPVLPDAGPWGRGRCGRDWPAGAIDVPPRQLRELEVDVVLLQRPEELGLATRWLGRTPGVDLPAIYVEHNTPKGDVPYTRHPMADRPELRLVHVTHFNDVIWDCGGTPTTVIEHGIPDPGPRYTGELARAAVVINDPIRRWRVTGTDLLPRFATAAPIDVFGMGAAGLGRRLGLDGQLLTELGDLHTEVLYDELARRRAYLHPVRWTSLGLSLIEAMHLAMPVVALASTEAVIAVPPEAGVVSTDVAELVAGVRRLVADRDLATQMGKHARQFALERYGLARFLDGWDRLLAGVTATTQMGGET
jgi:glycosyltransferase involved in cell wall biosynthesis